MDITSTIFGIVSGGAFIGGIIAWVRFRKKDRADVSKTQAEANTIIVEGFRNLLHTYQNENKLLQLTVDELKKQVFKLQEQLNKLQKNGR